MDTMNVALPEAMKDFVLGRVEHGGYSSVSEYVRDLIRADQKQQALAVLDSEIMKGLHSGEPTPMTREDWAAIREEVRRRHAQRKSR